MSEDELRIFTQFQTMTSGRLVRLQPALTGLFLSPDTLDRQLFSASLSTDDVTGLSQSQPSLSRSSTLPYDHVPQRAQPQHGLRAKARPRSPGSEMVTLEEFLQESNQQSPLMVNHRRKVETKLRPQASPPVGTTDQSKWKQSELLLSDVAEKGIISNLAVVEMIT